MFYQLRNARLGVGPWIIAANKVCKSTRKVGRVVPVTGRNEGKLKCYKLSIKALALEWKGEKRTRDSNLPPSELIADALPAELQGQTGSRLWVIRVEIRGK